ncbi:MAG: hypothetical protein ACOH5I_06225 [Oligoflexus sp.]
MLINKLKYTALERLGSLPKLKSHLKFGYRLIGSIASNAIFRPKFSSGYEIQKFGKEEVETFFGYYDKSPLNYSESKVLYHRIKTGTWKKPQPNMPIEIVVEDFNNGRELMSIKSQAYNWQQGSRTHWLDNKTFIFNDFDSTTNSYVSKIVCLDTGKETRIDRPIYETSGTNIGLSLDFRLLMRYNPDYGYSNLPFTDYIPDDDYLIHKVNLSNGHSHGIIPTKKVRSFLLDNHPNYKGQQIWVNHIMASPNGSRFIFTARFEYNNRRIDSLFSYSFDQDSLSHHPTGSIVSHYSWLNNESIIVYMKSCKGDRSFFKYNLSKDLYEKIDLPGMTKDGHPSTLGNMIVIDSYPSFGGFKNLYLLNISTLQASKLGRFYERLRYFGSCRCDLHPRFSMSGKFIFFDSVHQGNRKLYSLKMAK